MSVCPHVCACPGHTQPWVHYLPVSPDFHDLLDVINTCEAALEWCEGISRRARQWMQWYTSRSRCVRDLLVYIRPHLIGTLQKPSFPKEPSFAHTLASRTYKLAADRLKEYLENVQVRACCRDIGSELSWPSSTKCRTVLILALGLGWMEQNNAIWCVAHQCACLQYITSGAAKGTQEPGVWSRIALELAELMATCDART
jgi:hypothetical protein